MKPVIGCGDGELRVFDVVHGVAGCFFEFAFLSLRHGCDVRTVYDDFGDSSVVPFRPFRVDMPRALVTYPVAQPSVADESERSAGVCERETAFLFAVPFRAGERAGEFDSSVDDLGGEHGASWDRFQRCAVVYEHGVFAFRRHGDVRRLDALQCRVLEHASVEVLDGWRGVRLWFVFCCSLRCEQF